LTGSASVTPSGGTAPYTYLWAPSGGTGSTATGLGAGTYTVTVTDANGCSTTASATVTEPPQLTVAVTTTPSTCGNANGSAVATETGGTGPYTYLWTPNNTTSGTLSNVVAGSYQITVTDANNCTASAIATVNNMGNPVATIVASDSVSCFGGNDGFAAAGASSGTGPYTFTWSNADTDSLAGRQMCCVLVTLTDLLRSLLQAEQELTPIRGLLRVATPIRLQLCLPVRTPALSLMLTVVRLLLW
jgi:hypothetical protein